MTKRMGLMEIEAAYGITRQTVWTRVQYHIARGDLALGTNVHRIGRRYEIDCEMVRALFGEPTHPLRLHFGAAEADDYTPAAERKRRICAQNLRRRCGQLRFDLHHWQEWAAFLGEAAHAEVEALAEAARALHEHMLRIEHGEEEVS